MTMWRLWAKKLINTILAEYLKTMIPFFYAILQVTFRENHKKIKKCFYLYILFYLLYFPKTMSSVFSAEMNSARQNTLLTVFMGFGEKSGFSPFLPLL